jgi:hypothetical protein
LGERRTTRRWSSIGCRAFNFAIPEGGTTIDQRALVDVVGKPFPVLMRDLVLDPLGMADSTFEQLLPSAAASRAAAGL